MGRRSFGAAFCKRKGKSMAFFEQLGATLNNASNSVTQKTKNFTEVNNLNKAINANQSNIQNLYLEIGRLYYEAHKDEADAVYANQCAAIREAFANIANLQAQIREKKGIILCPNCGSEVANGVVSCPSCGMQVRQVSVPEQPVNQGQVPPVQQPVNQGQVPPVQQPVSGQAASGQSASITCAQCGSQIPSDSAFCPVCGQRV